MGGWVKIHRKLLDWQWFSDSRMVQLFVYLLLSASVEDRTWRATEVKRGQVLTSLAELSEATGISVQGIRTCLARLENSGEINKQTTNKFTLITICKFDVYQVEELPSNKRSNKQSTNNQQTKQESSPHTPFKEVQKKEKNYCCSSPACACEEQQEQKLFWIFYLKGASSPREERENFISWNMTPERAAAWENCTEAARYAAANRWKVRGGKLPGFSERAGRALKEIVEAFMPLRPELMEELYDRHRYPCELADGGTTLIIRCPGTVHGLLESNLETTKRILGRNGITRLTYTLPD